MKVLFLARYVYNETMPEFTKNKTGFGLMTNDIVKGISTMDEVFVLTRVITKGKNDNDYYILKHNWINIFKYFSIKYLVKGIKEAINLYGTTINKLKSVYFYLDEGYIREIIKTLKPDIIHIHGIGESSKIYIDVCDELGVPYVVTLHGLIGLDDSVLASHHEKKLEKEFLINSEKRNIPVTVISSGIKKRIAEYYGSNGNNIQVITNGTSLEQYLINDINIRERYSIPHDNNIILCVGNISERKNQIQMVEAYNATSEEFKKITTILFLGSDGMNGKLQNRVKELSLDKNIIYCGFVDKQIIQAYFEQANLNVVVSLDEGFGLSMIEGFVHGIPTLTFSDLDAIEDLYSEKAMLLVNERSDEALAQGIEKAFERKWNKKWIQEYSKQFSLEKMAQKYHNLYSVILEQINK